MIELLTADTPNGKKISIMLEEIKFDYKVTKINLYKDGGYVLIRPSLQSWSLLRLPIYKFRPSQADPLHFDLWHKGLNLLRDSGTYSYNSSEQDLKYFSSIRSHNTIQFDEKEPMPKLSRFLWGDWLEIESFRILNSTEYSASYRCSHGRHQRHVKVNRKSQKWIVTDNVSCYKKNVVVRWRLYPMLWEINENTISSKLASLEIVADKDIDYFNLVMGSESLFYNEKSNLPVLEVKLTNYPSTITTTITLK